MLSSLRYLILPHTQMESIFLLHFRFLFALFPSYYHFLSRYATLSLYLYFSFPSYLILSILPLHLSKSLSSKSVVTEKALRDCQSSKEQLDRTAKIRSGHLLTLDIHLHVLVQYIFPIKLIIMFRCSILSIPTSLSN